MGILDQNVDYSYLNSIGRTPQEVPVEQTDLVTTENKPYDQTKIDNLFFNTENPTVSGGVPLDKGGRPAVKYDNADFFPTRPDAVQQGGGFFTTIAPSGALFPFAAVLKGQQERQMQRDALVKASKIDYSIGSLKNLEANNNFQPKYINSVTSIANKLKNEGVPSSQILNHPEMVAYQKTMKDAVDNYNTYYTEAQTFLNDPKASKNTRESAFNIVNNTNKIFSSPNVSPDEMVKGWETVTENYANLVKGIDATKIIQTDQEHAKKVQGTLQQYIFDAKKSNTDIKVWDNNTLSGLFLKYDDKGNIVQDEDGKKNHIIALYQTETGLEFKKKADGSLELDKNGMPVLDDQDSYNQIFSKGKLPFDKFYNEAKDGYNTIATSALETIDNYNREYYKEQNKLKKEEFTIPTEHKVSLNIGNNNVEYDQAVSFTPDNISIIKSGTLVTDQKTGKQEKWETDKTAFITGVLFGKKSKTGKQGSYVKITPAKQVIVTETKINTDGTEEQVPVKDIQGNYITKEVADYDNTKIINLEEVKSLLPQQTVDGRRINFDKEMQGLIKGNVSAKAQNEKGDNTITTFDDM